MIPFFPLLTYYICAVGLARSCGARPSHRHICHAIAGTLNFIHNIHSYSRIGSQLPWVYKYYCEWKNRIWNYVNLRRAKKRLTSTKLRVYQLHGMGKKFEAAFRFRGPHSLQVILLFVLWKVRRRGLAQVPMCIDNHNCHVMSRLLVRPLLKSSKRFSFELRCFRNQTLSSQKL